jgi:hypothetical protein
VSGGFDNRIRIVSGNTLKAILSNNYHNGIVNSITLEKKSDHNIIVYSVSEDGNLAILEIEI